MVLFFLATVQLCAYSQKCSSGKSLLFYKFDSSFDEYTDPGFLNNFLAMLKAPLEETGYCLTKLDSSVLKDSTRFGNLVMLFRMELWPMEDEKEAITVSINLLKISELLENKAIPLENALVSLSFDPAELSTFEGVLIKKILENLRMHYVCHLRIQSSPSGVKLRTESGLEALTPLEWILPVGDLKISGEYPGYEPVKQTIDIKEPGTHTYFLQLRKKQFYHSKWIYPAAVFGVGAAAGFICERYFYKQYDGLGKTDYLERPDIFSTTYTKAKAFQIVGIASSITSGLFLSFTFIF